MKFSSFMEEGIILWDAVYGDYKDVYREVARLFSKKTGLKDSDIYDSFIKRDELGTTGIGRGFAVPHGRIEDFNDVVITVVKLKTPLELPVDKYKTDFMFFLLTSGTGSNLYLKTLSSLAKIVSKYGDTIRLIKNKHGFIEFIRRHDVNLVEPVRVSEIMVKNPVTVRLDLSIKGTLDIMKKHDVRYLPVVDKQDRYAGKIDSIDILKIAYPPYILMMHNLSFLSTFRAYEELEKREESKKVSDVYVPSGHSRMAVCEDASIVELGFLMVKNGWRYVTVTDKKDKVTGLVSMATIVNKILRT